MRVVVDPIVIQTDAKVKKQFKVQDLLHLWFSVVAYHCTLILIQVGEGKFALSAGFS